LPLHSSVHLHSFSSSPFLNYLLVQVSILVGIHFLADLVQFEGSKHLSMAAITVGEGIQAFSFPQNQVPQGVYHAPYQGILSVGDLLSQYQLAHFACLQEYREGIRS
jgi:hypothetical protein